MKRLGSPKFLLLVILLLGLFFRIYKLEIFFPWGHDQDLFAWIAKDMIIDHHFRLIGQETSITGVFIGPVFYYLMAISMALFKMNPLGVYIPITIISLLTIFSIYWVFNKFFGKNIGLIGSFLYAISPGIILLDRWVVPTQPTNLWVIWYLYVLLEILSGKLPLILIGILVGLIWHVHVAFVPLLILVPVALWLSKKRGNKIRINTKSIVISFLMFFSLLLPFFTFEIRHGFQQIKGLTRATYEEKGDVKGLKRFAKVLNISGRSLGGIFLLDKNPSIAAEFFMLLPVLFLFSVIYLYKIKKLTRNQTIIFGLWIGIDLLTQFISKRSIPEYYFANLFIVFFLMSAILVSTISIKRPFLISLLIVTSLLITISWLITQPDELGGFLQKRKTIEYIKGNALANNYSCIAINYVEGQPGLPNGFRYLFWLNNLKVITAANDVPVYSIVTPWTISGDEINAKFGMFGVILPHQKNLDFKVCSDPKRQLLPLWGFTK
ncbi:MAG: glycosyltransferase family 39 protein [Candidatus Daviesbacteria bacterium]|nr:glycosyltransferase family 39 protein [Candidatus Daviesbacteria bacterium]